MSTQQSTSKQETRVYFTGHRHKVHLWINTPRERWTLFTGQEISFHRHGTFQLQGTQALGAILYLTIKVPRKGWNTRPRILQQALVPGYEYSFFQGVITERKMESNERLWQNEVFNPAPRRMSGTGVRKPRKIQAL